MSMFGSYGLIATALATIVPALALIWILGQIRLNASPESQSPSLQRFRLFKSAVWVSVVLVSFLIVELALAFTVHSVLQALAL